MTRGRGVATRAHGVVTRGRGLVLDRRRRESEERRDLTSMVQAGAGARQLGMAGVDYDTIYLSIGKICFLSTDIYLDNVLNNHSLFLKIRHTCR